MYRSELKYALIYTIISKGGFFMLERKLRGKKFIRSAESYDGPDVLRVTSKLIDGKYYKYISSSGEEGKILDQELFLNYQAFKPDYVLGFRVFRSSDINGTKYLNCYLVYNPYLSSSEEVLASTSVVLDGYEWIKHCINPAEENTYAVRINSHKDTFFDNDGMFIVKRLDTKWLYSSFWYGYLNDDLDEAASKLHSSMERFIKDLIAEEAQNENDSKRSIWYDIMQMGNAKSEIKKYLFDAFKLSVKQPMQMDLHIVEMRNNKFIYEQAYLNKPAFERLIDDARKTDILGIKDPLKKKNLDRAINLLQSIHFLGGYPYIGETKPDMQSIEMEPYKQYQPKDRFYIGNNNGRYIVLLQFGREYMYLTYKLDETHTAPALSDDELAVFLSKKK